MLMVVTATVSCGKDDPEKYVRSATTALEQGRTAEAIIDFRHALQLDPRLGEARLKLGEAYEKEKNYPAALGEFVRAADLLPDNADAQIRAGNLLLLARRFEDAGARAHKALDKHPDNTDAQILQANALAGMKDFDGAVTEYEAAIAADPTKRDVYTNVGVIQFLQGKPAEAEQAFARAVEAAPKSVRVRLAQA